MDVRGKVVPGLLAAALGVTTVHAAPIVTAPLQAGAAVSTSCTVVNAGPDVISPTIEIVTEFGFVAAGITPSLGAGFVTQVVNPSPSFHAYCRVSGVSPRRVRVTFCNLDALGNCIMASTAP
jgi:hypothetical protein